MTRSSLDDFSESRYHRSRKSWKSGPDDSVFHPKHTYTFNSYRFPSVRLKNNSVNFWWLFRASVPPEEEKLKIRAHMTRFSGRNWPTLFVVQFLGRRWLGLGPETYPHFLGCSSYRFASLRQKMFRLNFDDLSEPEYHRCSQSWKLGSNDYVSHPKHIYTVYGAVSIVSRQYSWKTIRSSLDKFSGPRYHRSRKSWKSSPDDSVFHPKHTYTFNSYRFPSVLLKNNSVNFWRLFRASVPPEQEKLKIRLGWLGFSLETYLHY